MTEGPPQPPEGVGSPGRAEGRRRERAGRRIDLVVGIIAGILLGVGIVTAFVFLGSENTIDAPRIEGGEGARAGAGGAGQTDGGAGQTGGGKQDAGAAQQQTGPEPAGTRGGARRGSAPRVAEVRVIGGAPPPSGPVGLSYRQGERVRLRVISDAPVTIEIPGYGIEETVSAVARISFRASRSGQFPVVVVPSMIGVASLRITR